MSASWRASLQPIERPSRRRRCPQTPPAIEPIAANHDAVRPAPLRQAPLSSSPSHCAGGPLHRWRVRSSLRLRLRCDTTARPKDLYVRDPWLPLRQEVAKLAENQSSVAEAKRVDL